MNCRAQIRLMISLFLLSMSLVAFQLHLVQLFQTTQWHHFAFMVISIAMLGFGAGGSLLTIFRSWFLRNHKPILPALTITTGLLMPVVIRLSQLSGFRFDSYLMFVETGQFSLLAINYLLFLLPFLSGGLMIGLIYSKYTSNTGTFYFADLLGAGFGGPLAIMLFWNFSPGEMASILAVLPMLSGSLFINRIKFRDIGLVILVAGLIIAGILFPVDLEYSEYKAISRTMQLPNAELIHQAHSPHGLVQTVRAPAIRFGPGLSVNYKGEVPNGDIVFNNGNWYGAVIPFSTDSLHVLEYTTSELAYRLVEPKHVLILRSSTGVETGRTIRKAIDRITAVEPHPVIMNLMGSELAKKTGLNSEVTIHSLEPRTFLTRTERLFDLIEIPIMGSFGGTVGLQALREETLITREGIQDMWNSLSRNGIISLSCWLDYPVRYPYKLASTIVAGLHDLDIHPANHVLAIQSWGTITFCIKKSKITQQDILNALAFCEEMGFEMILKTEMTQSSNELHNIIQKIFGPDRNEIITAYGFNIEPTSDNQPYFSQFLKWSSFRQYQDQMAAGTGGFLELGYFLLMVTLVQVIILALLFIIIPLLKLRWTGNGKTWTLIYFLGLGFGFLFLEMVLIKHFTLFLGQPIYALAFTISTLLISSGLGSLYSSRFTPSPSIIKWILILIVGLIVFLSVIIIPTIQFTLFLSLPWRIVIAMLLIAAPAFVMGMAFPTGLRLLSAGNENLVPWAWGINGCASVVATTLASIIAVEFGFFALLLSSALCYGLAFGVSLIKLK